MRSAEYLEATEIVDFRHAKVAALAAELGQAANTREVARRCFEWVRDRIRHSGDHQDDVVTVSASEVLQTGTGLCYAKSHLLAALLRANRIPCGFAYQRLALDEHGSAFCLHGLNAVQLPDIGWYRVDARGDRADIATRFDPPREYLAFTTRLPGEGLVDGVFADPLLIVISTLRRHTSLTQLADNWPDWHP